MIKELSRNMDYGLFIAVIFLMVMGVLMIHSAGSGENVALANMWQKQAIWAIFSLLIMIAVIPIPYKAFYVFAYALYGFGLFLLLFTELRGYVAGGSERWLNIGPIRFQPSEFMKVATVLALARYLSEKNNRPTSFYKLIIPILIVLVPMGLIVIQPDLGTSLIMIAIIFPLLYWAGLDSRRLFFLTAPAISGIISAPIIPFFNQFTWVFFMFVILGMLYYSRYTIGSMGAILATNISAGIVTPLVYGSLNPYQQDRITTFLNPEANPLGAGYQIINSKITIGSGGLYGKGLGKGSFTDLGFLPQAHTDFIFSVIGEELGYIGSVFILCVIFYIVYRGIMIATEVNNPFMSIVSIGIASIFAFHVFVNVGMVLGIMPVTGLPLPFLSYGGSSCLANAIMVGLILNFRVNRHEY